VTIHQSTTATGVPLAPDTTPPYPDLGPTVAKFRRLASKGLAAMLVTDRRAYADAIEKAIRAKQRAELQRELPSHRVNCASGTDHNDGEKIHEAIRAKHRAKLLAAPSQERRARKPEDWKKMYREAMEEKRERESAPAPIAKPAAAERKPFTPRVIVGGKQPPAPIVAPMERKAKLPAKAEAKSTRPKAGAGYAIVPMKQKGKFVVKVDRLPDGSKAMPEVVIGNQIKCRFSHRDAGYIASTEQLAKFERIVGMLT
jgi:hypothetical protein